MLGFILIFGFGLVIAMAYNAFADKGEASAKLKRVQAELARKEALEKDKKQAVQNVAENTPQKDK